MTDSVTMGSLADKLLLFISTTMVRDSNYDIAVEMVKNYGRLRGMSITEVSELCYVSKASISRFCRFMGFDSFKSFKEYLNLDFSIHNDYSRQLSSMLAKDTPSALSAYRDELIENIYATLNESNMSQVPKIVEEIHGHEHVAFFSHHFLQELGQFFQGKLMMMGKYMEMYLHYEGQKECAGALDEKSLAIICTIGGTYLTRYPEIWNRIITSRCKVIVITQNMGNPYLNEADYVLQCGAMNKDDSGKYAVLLLLDYIVMSYMKRYD